MFYQINTLSNNHFMGLHNMASYYRVSAIQGRLLRHVYNYTYYCIACSYTWPALIFDFVESAYPTEVRA